MIELNFVAPTGHYNIAFEPQEDTPIDVRHGDHVMQWFIEVAEGDDVFQGMTRGAKRLWGDEFWFEITLGPPARIGYFGHVLVRTDVEHNA